MTIQETAAFLLNHDGFLLVTHKNPDGDTLGSASALCHALNRLGKSARLYRNPEITEKYIPYVAPFLTAEEFNPQCIVSVDVAAANMVCLGFEGSFDLAIDHHETNAGFGTYNCIYPGKSACGEIILEIIEAMNLVPDEAEATLLYMAVSTDTGCFVYGNTNADTFAAGSRLLAYGAQNKEINLRFFRKFSKSRLSLEGMILNSMEFYREGKIVIASIPLEMMIQTGATEDDTDDLAAIPGRVDTQVVGVLIREKEAGKSKVSVRTLPEVNAYAICSRFGGGGHDQAAGCTIPVPPAQAKEQILQVINEVWPE